MTSNLSPMLKGSAFKVLLVENNLAVAELLQELLLEANEIPLYKRVVHPEHPNLYFIGLLQPLGPIMPLAELQSQWVAELLEGKVGLPSKEAMKRDIEKEREAIHKRYVNSKRHTMQVDFYPYVAQVKKEMKQGRLRPPRQALTQFVEEPQADADLMQSAR